MTCPPDCLACWLTNRTRTEGLSEAMHERQSNRPRAPECELIAYGSGWLDGHIAGVEAALALRKIGGTHNDSA
jgi:hypothetical protein